MSKLLVSEFGESPLPNPQHDLLARLYREIGVSAVAAALEVVNAPAAADASAAKASEPQTPAFLREDKTTLAA